MYNLTLPNLTIHIFTRTDKAVPPLIYLLEEIPCVQKTPRLEDYFIPNWLKAIKCLSREKWIHIFLQFFLTRINLAKMTIPIVHTNAIYEISHIDFSHVGVFAINYRDDAISYLFSDELFFALSIHRYRQNIWFEASDNRYFWGF